MKAFPAMLRYPTANPLFSPRFCRKPTLVADQNYRGRSQSKRRELSVLSSFLNEHPGAFVALVFLPVSRVSGKSYPSVQRPKEARCGATPPRAARERRRFSPHRAPPPERRGSNQGNGNLQAECFDQFESLRLFDKIEVPDENGSTS